MDSKSRKCVKFVLIPMALLFVACFTTACQPVAVQPEPATGSSGTVQPTQTVSAMQAVPSQPAIPTGTQTAASGPLSPTTGLPGNAEYRPVQVMIDNEEAGRPQTGTQAADIVYEALVAGAGTRLSAIYNDALPEKVGPVRSSRVYFQMIQNEWDSIFMHDGGPYVAALTQSYVYSPENGGDMKMRIDATRRNDDNILWHASSSTAFANVQAAEEKYNYPRTRRDPAFAFDANADYAKYKGFSKIDVPFTGEEGYNQVEYVYDQSTGLLTRYYLGQPFVDTKTNKAVTVKNVIVQYVTDTPLSGITPNENMKHILPDERDLIQIGMVGSGRAEFFIGGKYMKGTWTKTDRHAGTVYKLDDGSGLVLKPGNTWIELQPDFQPVATTMADGTTQIWQAAE